MVHVSPELFATGYLDAVATPYSPFPNVECAVVVADRQINCRVDTDLAGLDSLSDYVQILSSQY